MPSAPTAYTGPTNGHHLVNANSMAALTNGQTQSSITSSSTISPHLQTQQQILQTNEECGIRDVWAHNLEDEFRVIRGIVQQYPYIAMDTEFPGVVARPIGQFTSTTDYIYQIMRVNIKLLKIIQLGLTFMDKNGKKPPGFSTWQFNFKFSLNDDMYAQESIDLLNNSGIQFKKHDEEGIDSTEFAIFLFGSGVVLSDNIYWLSFHSGYDFGYLLKMLTNQQLPKKESEFFELLKIYFPRVYDLKYLMKSIKNLKGGLQEVAEQLDLVRKGPQHQAGSDSLLTGETFFKIRELFFEDNIEEKRYSGFIYGLEVVEPKNSNTDDEMVYVNNGNTISSASSNSNNGSSSNGSTTGNGNNGSNNNGTSTTINNIITSAAAASAMNILATTVSPAVSASS